ncbi:MAG TPA: CAP domain-containing protein [Chitinispirillaceae bacterium]|nr:CAP domain-containing protein [Chitinispirillaceae bacterium]
MTNNNTIKLFLTNWMIVFYFQNAYSGYGDPQDSLPSAFEREVLVMTNAVRMAPVAFRNTCIAGTSILSESVYPAVPPLLYNQDLSRAARFHSIDMAKNCGMAHNSCDGTSFSARISTFYKDSATIAENIATGKTNGLQTVIQWLRDDIQNVPAVDGSGNDGHRKNIMNAVYKEQGCGYAYNGSRQWYHFWTQDFGAGKVAMVKVPAGCHFNPDNTTLTFAANYYEPSGAAPSSAAVIIDNDAKKMDIMLGTAAKGTWSYSMPDDKKTHCYYFLFTDASEVKIRFPETATLTTGNELSCTASSVINGQSVNAQRISYKNRNNPASMYSLNGVQITGKLAIYRYASGILCGKEGGRISVNK